MTVPKGSDDPAAMHFILSGAEVGPVSTSTDRNHIYPYHKS